MKIIVCVIVCDCTVVCQKCVRSMLKCRVFQTDMRSANNRYFCYKDDLVNVIKVLLVFIAFQFMVIYHLLVKLWNESG